MSQPGILQPWFLRWGDWREGRSFSDRTGRNLVCSFLEENTARDYVLFIDDC